MKGNLALKRVVAYFIDAMIIMLVSSALTSLTFINPKYEEYEKANEEYNSLIESYYDEEIETEEFSEKTIDISYSLYKNGYVYTIGNIVITFLYFGLFASVTKGQTLGKRLMKVRIVKNDGSNAKWYQYYIRTFILNGVILNVVTLIAICFSRDTFYTIYSYGSNFDTILLIVNFIMILFQKDGRGLHDLIAGTKVIDLNAPITESVEEEQEEVTPVSEEAEIIKPKKKRSIKKDAES